MTAATLMSYHSNSSGPQHLDNSWKKPMNAQKVIKDVFERGVKEGVFFESQAHQFRSAVSNIFVKLAETKEVPLEYIGQDASSRKYVYQVKCDSAHAKLYESPFTVHLPEPTDAAFKMTMSEHSVW